jgi:cohesin complex subunit SCC1
VSFFPCPPNLFYRDLDFDDRPVQPQGQHIARTADITLATVDDFQMDFEDADNSLLGPSDGIGSQDFIDLGLNFGPEASDADDTMSVEVGREAPVPRTTRDSIGSHLLGETGMDDLELLSQRSREASEHPFAPDVDMGFGPDLGGDMDIDLGLNFEPLMSDHEKTPGQTTRACK